MNPQQIIDEITTARAPQGEIHKGSASAPVAGPGQLPQGEAQRVNEALQAVPGGEQASTAPQPEAGSTPAPSTSQGGAVQTQAGFRPTSDAEKFLFGPTQRPDEPVAVQSFSTVPPGTDQWLPYLSQWAAEPNAPLWAKQMLARVMEQLRNA